MRPAWAARLYPALWPAAGAVVVLAARCVAYALAPSPDVVASSLEHQAGGPRLAVIAAIALPLAAVFAGALLGVAALGVRERHLLETRPAGERPRLRLTRAIGRAGLLWLGTCVAFALFESYLHWRAGLGWHGLHCLLGPVHRDAVPILAALSILASAIIGACEHVVAWIRRIVGRWLARRARPTPMPEVAAPSGCPFSLRSLLATLGPRAPPRRSPIRFRPLAGIPS